jgi:trimeric autotransporter adhesin
VTVTGVAPGLATISASTSNVGSATGKVTVRSDIILPDNPTVNVGESVVFPVSLANPAPAGGVFIKLTSSDTSKVTLTVEYVLIHEGETTSSYAKLNGIAFGSVTITAEAYGFSSATTTAQATSGTLAFVPSSLTITGDGVQSLTLALTPISLVSVTLNLSSTDPTVATVPATITIPANASSVDVPVTALQNGSTVIHASSSTLADTTANVDVSLRIVLQTIQDAPLTPHWHY